MDVGCWMLVVGCVLVSLLPLRAQVAVNPQPIDPLLQLMISQPSIEVTSNLVATAGFDPVTVKPGELAIYRFTVNGLNDSVEWPEEMPFPPEFETRLSSRGQSLALVPGEPKLRPQTAINFHVRANRNGIYYVPSFDIRVYDRVVRVPAAQLFVSADAPAAPPQLLSLELGRTNCYVGQPVPVRVLLKTGTIVQSLQEMKLNGEGFLVDFANARQSIAGAPDGSGAAFVYETTLTPLRAGVLHIAAQAFTAGNLFSGAVVIRGQVTIPGGPPQYRLLDSEPVAFRVQTLPRAGELPGFSGAIGQFRVHPPQLSTNRLRAGDALRLTVTLEGSGNMARLIPPAPPRSTNWQIFPAERGGAATASGTPVTPPGALTAFTYTLVPLTDRAKETPAVPFSYFNPDTEQYVDATIPPVKVSVEPGEAPISSETFDALTRAEASEKRLRLSDVTADQGWTASSLRPLQYRGWFVALQLLPLAGFLALWQWDRRRRFYEQHPEVLIRRRARRAVRRARREVEQAFARRDAKTYLSKAIHAIQLAAAPQQSAEPKALVGRDVAPLFSSETAGAEMVRRLFAASDAIGFSTNPESREEVLQLHTEVNQLLNALEGKL